MSNSPSNRSPAVVAWTRLNRIHQKLDALGERHFRNHGLSSAWFDVLVRVGAQEGLCQEDLAETLLVTKGNVSQLVAKMVASGLVERRADGRRQRLFLTGAGRQLRTQTLPGQEALLADSLSSLSPQEQHDLVRLLRKWEQA